MHIKTTCRTPLGHRVESVLDYPTSGHPAARQIGGRFAEVLIELPDGTFSLEVWPLVALTVGADR